MRKKVQLLVILTILAWATQTLFHQWGFGKDILAQEAPSEKFVPGAARFAAGATLELRAEATVVGGEVKLKQVCRWSKGDEPVFAPLADLVIARVAEGEPFKGLALDDIRSTLRDAGVNIAMIRFSGPTGCTVTRSDVEFDEQDALLKWANAKGRTREVSDVPGTPVTAAADARAEVGPRAAPEGADESLRTLRDVLIDDLAVRLRLPRESLQVTFNPRDEQALKLAEPQFRFDVQPRRVRNLGQVAWDVQIVTAGDGAALKRSQKMTVSATARAWQQQVELAKPVAYRQVIRDADVSERRVLADAVSEQPLLSRQQVVGQQAATELKAGSVMTARTIQPVPLARSGQFVTVTLARGGVRIKTVARAMEEGSFGQTIKVKNEATRDVYQVVLTGPQEGTLGPAESPVASAGAK